MFKLLFGLGFIIAPLYKLLRNSAHRSSASSNGVPQPLFQFSPKLTIVTNISVPVRSNNAAGESKPAPGIADKTKSIIKEMEPHKLSRQPDEYLSTGTNGKVIPRASSTNANSESSV